MSIPSISTLPPAPNRNDPANFSDIADVFVAALPAFEAETNAAIDAMNLDLADASANIEAAQATANYKGLWNTLTGALNTPASVSHNSVTYVLVNNLADVTLSEPGEPSGDGDWDAFGISSAVTATNVELNLLDGCTATTAQLNFLSNTTSDIQSQIDGKAASVHTHTSSQITDATNLNTANRIVKRDGTGNFSAGTITAALTGNATSATKLQNTRNIALGGDCSGSVNFDGTSNVTITATVLNNSHSHTSGNISDATASATANRVVKRDSSANFSAGTITAALNGNAASATTAAACTGNSATATQANNALAVNGQTFTWSNSSNSPTYLWAANSNGTAFLASRGSISVNYANSAGTATTTTGNAATASSAAKLTTARTIDITGDITATAVAFDGTSNIAISASVNNNSHSHTSANISDATSANTASKIVERDGNGDFSARIITASLAGNATTSSSCTGNAASATKWATSRTFDIIGDVTGAGISFNGTQNVTFTAAVVDNSHHHNDSTINGLNASAITAGTLTRPTSSSSASCTGNAVTATTASKCTINSSGSTGLFNMLWNSGTSIYGEAGMRVQPSSDSLYASGNVTAYYSDERLKDRTRDISDALEKVASLDAFYYVENETARSLGYTKEGEQVGLSAQQVQKVLPEIVSLAPCDLDIDEDGVEYSRSGENYLTIDYAKLVPLLVASIQELTRKVEALEKSN